MYFKEFPIMQIRYHYGNLNDNMFNTTKLIRNMTQHLDICTRMVEDMVNYGIEE